MKESGIRSCKAYMNLYDAVRRGMEVACEDTFWIISDKRSDVAIYVCKWVPAVINTSSRDWYRAYYEFTIYDLVYGEIIENYSADYYGDSRDAEFMRTLKHIETNYVDGFCRRFMEEDEMCRYIAHMRREMKRKEAEQRAYESEQRARESARREREKQENEAQERAAEKSDVEWCKRMFFQGCDSVEMLKKKYRNAMKCFHPDNAYGSENVSKCIQAAYESLMEQLG